MFRKLTIAVVLALGASSVHLDEQRSKPEPEWKKVDTVEDKQKAEAEAAAKKKTECCTIKIASWHAICDEEKKAHWYQPFC